MFTKTRKIPSALNLFLFLFTLTFICAHGSYPLNASQLKDFVPDGLEDLQDEDFLINMPRLKQKQTYKTYNMYSSDDKKFVWFRVFKVASATTRVFLKKNVDDLTQSRPTSLPNKYKDYFKFAFVRNPWDRVVSCYFHKVVTKEISVFQECFDKDFEYFVDFINRTDLTKANAHIKLQTKLIPADQLDFIGKLDNFANDFQYVCNVIGLEYHPLGHKHQTDHAHYSTYYTPRLRKIIAKKYQADIEAFGFTFETE